MIMTTYTEQELPGISLTTGDTEFPVTAMTSTALLMAMALYGPSKQLLRTHLIHLPKQCLLSHCLLAVP